ncbi:MAG: ComEC/Rec2-related protein [candidate division Kazan bacterium GW2011_GWC1_52_13]|nr:MAG: ComEC/Rec2-related protein [candidate division Kazan bacterium GW2011_GWC1_52_13]
MLDLAFLSSLRESIIVLVREALPEPQASLLLGMILGVKSGFPQDFYEALRITGTLHVVVVSGFNITVIINTLARFFSFLPLKPRFLITFLFITAFVLLVGVNPPVIRAALMGSIALLGTVLGRQRDALRILLLSSVVMLLFQPSWLVELSFQLSFLATLGLIVGQPVLDRVIPGAKGMLLREDFITTASAQLLVWPLIAYHFGQVSLLSPIINALILWVVPLLTYMGLVTITIGLLINKFTLLIMLPNRVFLDFFVEVVKLFSSVKVGYFAVSPFGLAALAFYFVVLGGLGWFLYQSYQQKRETA